MFDAASRLAEGRPAADTVQEYVWACHLLGFQDPDLTLHASQVRDWYGSEDGIDLAALDADCEALRTAAAAAEGALARQDAQIALISAAWRGPGAEASRDFLRRHGEAAAAVASAVRQAAESLASLRDRLWRSVDGKVAATLAAQARGARPDWRDAVQTVTGGLGDRATASELIDREVKPFVDNDIRAEWLTAMQSAIAAVTDAYDSAVNELTSEAVIAFDVPGELGPSWSPSPGDGADTTPAGAAWSTPPAAQPMSVPQPPPPTAAPVLPPPLPAAPPVDPAAMAPPSAPSLGGGMPDIGSGLSGFGSQLGDMLGGLLGTSQDSLSDLPEPGDLDEGDEPDELDDLDEDKPEDDEEDLDEEDLDEDDEKAGEADGAETDPAAEIDDESEPVEPLSEPLPPVPTETPVEPPPVPAPLPPPPAPMSAAGTPCEIAANELPQVGE